MTRAKRKYIEFAIKLGVVLLLIWALYHQVFARENLEELKISFLAHFQSDNLYWLLVAVLLMPVNWAFETLKWRQLIKGFEKSSFWQTYQGIFAGVTFSLFTPNRIGEYGGRILFVAPENNWKAVIATLVGSFSQLLVLLSMGLLGLVVFGLNYLEVDPFILRGVVMIGIALISLMLFCFFNIDLVIPIVRRIPYIHLLRRFVKNVSVLRNYSSIELATTLFFAFSRYLVYTTQYYLMLRFFGIDMPLLIGYAGVATIFLLQTSVPLPPLMGLLARGEVALFVWKYFTSNQVDILAATFGLFILNLIIPALIGAVFIIGVNVLKSLGFENGTTSAARVIEPESQSDVIEKTDVK